MTQLDLLTDRGAEISTDGRYRHVLWRRWADTPRGDLGFILLNPSTADAIDDDPTVRRCVGFARRDGYGGIRIANLFDLRATHPVELINNPDPVGPKNDPWARLVMACTTVVVGWGAVHKLLRWRVGQVVDLAGGWPMWCLGTTDGGDPRHPLYLRADTPLQPWTPGGGS